MPAAAMRRRRVAWAAVAMLAIARVATAANGEPIVLLVGGIEKQIYLPVRLAEQLGYFREQGLQV